MRASDRAEPGETQVSVFSRDLFEAHDESKGARSLSAPQAIISSVSAHYPTAAIRACMRRQVALTGFNVPPAAQQGTVTRYDWDRHPRR